MTFAIAYPRIFRCFAKSSSHVAPAPRAAVFSNGVLAGAHFQEAMHGVHTYMMEEGGQSSVPAPTQAGKSSSLPHYHQPVLMEEVLHYLQPEKGKVFLDGTLGGGGHSEALLKTGARVIALDQDLEALAYARERLSGFGDQFSAYQSNFRDFPQALESAGVSGVDGMLVDIGVSSHQINDPARGFSFMHDGPLDMRMDCSQGRTAADIVNEDDLDELGRILREYGEEWSFRRIVKAIGERRKVKPFTGTKDLADVISSVMPRHGKVNPATLTFQALRIAVNDELAAFTDFLNSASRWLNPGGRLVVISFHSLEDRIAKQTLLRFTTEWNDRPEWPEPRRNPEYTMRLLTRKPVEAKPDEVKQNPRARSAKLRSAEKLPQ
ncbi:16S rRNA (cytosine(1402)-N(4))-methyltransferase RsmH [soil metagenome]